MAPILPKKLVICGPPAGGKGTQCELLVEKYGVVHLSTGDMLRSAIQAGSEMGWKAKTFMDAGELVPDDVVIDVILHRLEEGDCVQKGWLLDGFPRTAGQAAAMLGRNIVPDVVIVLHVPDDEVVRRISGRRVDPETGKTYHLTFNPPPTADVAARVVQRSDDTEETLRTRLVKYHDNCAAVVEMFKSTSKVLNVDGMQAKEAVAAEICRTVDAAHCACVLQ
ncbi:Aste57867_24578 [Aphanomyces stellatus]|uniref:Aste57867_24578 protein n=1 Tax=Aphanomyces stellatus TaxID=120398 RepID=A0A485LRV1_9STRA|nr:hypothetical protein As57867_024500 [Aphanomyces stellatus]VFU01217.1 Aste57867_24578 [Aphanomyces stellatus]